MSRILLLLSGGTLFLDELAEFSPKLLDCLRQPLENRVVNLARSNIRATLPADFLLVAAMNPCPCGGGPPGQCECGEAQLARYHRRLSGPLLDRFDLRVPVTKPGIDELLGGGGGEPSSVAAARVLSARALAVRRQGVLNARLDNSVLDDVAPLEPAASAMLRREVEEDRLTARGYYRVRRVARTIADLSAVADSDAPAGVEVTPVEEATIALALCLRSALGRPSAARAA